jgi:hypothetical protein
LLAPTVIAKLDKNVIQQPSAPGEAIQNEVDARKIDFQPSKVPYFTR